MSQDPWTCLCFRVMIAFLRNTNPLFTVCCPEHTLAGDCFVNLSLVEKGRTK